MSTFGDDDSTSRPVRDDRPATGTTSGAETTARMTGMHKTDHDARRTDDGFRNSADDGFRNSADDGFRNSADDGDSARTQDSRHPDTDHLRYVDDERRETETRRHERPVAVRRAKTSVAATFGLVFGLAALFCALTAILAPAAVVFGLIGIVVAIAGMKMAKRPGVTGRGVAIGGLVTATLGLLLGAAVLAGAAVLVNDEQRLDQLQSEIEDLRADLPSTAELREELPS